MGAQFLQSLQPQSIIPPGSQAPSPQQIQQGLQQQMPGSQVPLPPPGQLRASTDPSTGVQGPGSPRNPLLELLASIGKA